MLAWHYMPGLERKDLVSLIKRDVWAKYTESLLILWKKWLKSQRGQGDGIVIFTRKGEGFCGGVRGGKNAFTEDVTIKKRSMGRYASCFWNRDCKKNQVREACNHLVLLIWRVRAHSAAGGRENGEWRAGKADHEEPCPTDLHSIFRQQRATERLSQGNSQIRWDE